MIRENVSDAACVKKTCSFGAIKDFSIGEFECEGCGVCVEICPVNAITMQDHVSGDMMLYKNDGRVFSTAQLKMGQRSFWQAGYGCQATADPGSA